MWLGRHRERLHINADLTAQEQRNNMGDQTSQGLAPQMFQMASGVLHFVESPLHPFAHTLEPRGKARGMGRRLVVPVRGEDVHLAGFPVQALPVFAHEPLVPDDLGLPQTVPHLVPATRSSVEVGTRS